MIVFTSRTGAEDWRSRTFNHTHLKYIQVIYFLFNFPFAIPCTHTSTPSPLPNAGTQDSQATQAQSHYKLDYYKLPC